MAFAAVGLPLLLMTTACAQPGSARESRATASFAPDLTQFHDQQLAFGPCAPYATTLANEALFANERFDCARMQVPLDYADPDGPRAEIALLRMKARGERIGSLVVNPGGPGGSGMSHTATMAPTLDPMPIGERFDIVGFDPRRVGATTPRVDCFTSAEDDRGDGFNGTLTPEDVPDARAAETIAQRCADSAGGEQALVHIGTRETVQDLDVLRAVLGDEQLSFLGYSYGTELGAVYAETFPDNLRAMLLDGAIDPELSGVEFTVSQAAGIQRAFDGMAAQCTSGPDCPLGTDPTRAVETYHALLRPLQDSPVPTTDGRDLTYEDAMTGVFAGMYSEDLWRWVGDSVYFLRYSRDALTLEMHRLDPTTGASTLVVQETGRTCVDPGASTVEPPLVRVLDSGEVLWWSQRDGWGHLYLYSPDGGKHVQVTSGEWLVRRVLWVDEDARRVWFLANGLDETDPYLRQICRIDLDGTGFTRLTDDELDHDATSPPEGGYVVDRASTVATPPRSSVLDGDGRVLVELEAPTPPRWCPAAGHRRSGSGPQPPTAGPRSTGCCGARTGSTRTGATR